LTLFHDILVGVYLDFVIPACAGIHIKYIAIQITMYRYLFSQV